MGQVFCRRLDMATAGVSVPTHFVWLPAVVRDDLSMWSVFLDQINGHSLLPESPMSNADLELYTDALGLVGFVAYFLGSLVCRAVA